MNILFVCSAKSWGGNEKWTSMAMKTLAEEHTIYFFGRKKHLGDSFGAEFQKDFAPMFANWDLYSFFKAWHFVKKHHIDCIVSTKKKEYFIFGLISRFLKIKHLIRLGIVRDMKNAWHQLLYQKLNDGIIVNAHRIEDNLRRFPFMKQKKVYVLYNAIPGLQRMSEVERKTGDVFQITSTGMLTRRKGFHILVEAIALLPSDIQKKIRLTFVGKGREEDSLKQLIKRHSLEDNIQLAGFQKDPSLFLQTSNLFVLLSDNEGISNALLEALAMGVPILSTDSGGTSEFIQSGTNGFIVDRDAIAVSKMLQKIVALETQDLNAIGTAGQKTVKQLFSEERFKHDIHQIFP